MKPRRVGFGMAGVAILAVGGWYVLTQSNPTLSAVNSYLSRAHRLDCNGYSVKVPYGWDVLPGSRCEAAVMLERRRNLLFDREAHASSLMIRPLAGANAEREQAMFQRQFPGRTFAASEPSPHYALCVSTGSDEDPTRIASSCISRSGRVQVMFYGEERGWGDALELVTAQP